MNQTTDTGNKRWFIWLSFIASIVSLIAFATGKNLPNFLADPTPASPLSPPMESQLIFSTPETITQAGNISTPTDITAPTATTEPTLENASNDWSGVLTVRKPTLNEIRAEKPVSLWNANLLTVGDMHVPGKETYTGEASWNAEYLLPVYWCATTSKQLAQNMENIETTFLVNEEVIPAPHIFSYDYDTSTGWKCSYSAVVLGGWTRNNEYVLRIKRVLSRELSDGQSSYSAGTYTYQLIVKAK